MWRHFWYNFLLLLYLIASNYFHNILDRFWFSRHFFPYARVEIYQFHYIVKNKWKSVTPGKIDPLNTFICFNLSVVDNTYCVITNSCWPEPDMQNQHSTLDLFWLVFILLIFATFLPSSPRMRSRAGWQIESASSLSIYSHRASAAWIGGS